MLMITTWKQSNLNPLEIINNFFFFNIGQTASKNTASFSIYSEKYIIIKK